MVSLSDRAVRMGEAVRRARVAGGARTQAELQEGLLHANYHCQLNTTTANLTLY